MIFALVAIPVLFGFGFCVLASRTVATLLERLSWILEDIAERIDVDAASVEAQRQASRNRDPLIDRVNRVKV